MGSATSMQAGPLWEPGYDFTNPHSPQALRDVLEESGVPEYLRAAFPFRYSLLKPSTHHFKAKGSCGDYTSSPTEPQHIPQGSLSPIPAPHSTTPESAHVSERPDLTLGALTTSLGRLPQLPTPLGADPDTQPAPALSQPRASTSQRPPSSRTRRWTPAGRDTFHLHNLPSCISSDENPRRRAKPCTSRSRGGSAPPQWGQPLRLSSATPPPDPPLSAATWRPPGPGPARSGAVPRAVLEPQRRGKSGAEVVATGTSPSGAHRRGPEGIWVLGVGEVAGLG